MLACCCIYFNFAFTSKLQKIIGTLPRSFWPLLIYCTFKNGFSKVSNFASILRYHQDSARDNLLDASHPAHSEM